jgi:hypothetical protein
MSGGGDFVRFYFRVEGPEGGLESLSEALGDLGAIKLRRHTGEPLTYTNKVYWQSYDRVASVGEEATRVIGECVKELGSIIGACKIDVALAWSLVVVLGPEERGTGVYLNRESIRGLADLGADIDVDLS